MTSSESILQKHIHANFGAPKQVMLTPAHLPFPAQISPTFVAVWGMSALQHLLTVSVGCALQITIYTGAGTCQ